MLFCYSCLRSQVILANREDKAMTTTLTEQPIPTGTWLLDTTHSSVTYAVRHSGVSLFRGGFKDFDATLADGQLRGSAGVGRITVEDEKPQGQLSSRGFLR